MRPQKEYNPPSDINNKLQNIFENYLKSNDSNTKLDDINKKFAVLNECFKEFNHAVPNSLLHTMETLGDLKQFYNTPVDVKTPFDKLKQMELPPNVHIQYEYHRFHPGIYLRFFHYHYLLHYFIIDTDTKFGGLTAFPRSSTLVTGLKYKDKYKGHEQSTQWPYNS